MADLAGFINVNEFWQVKNEVIAATGVNIFFIISGFLITNSLITHKDVKVFYCNRVIRIYPVYLILLLVMFTIGPIINFDWFADISLTHYFGYFFGNLFMLQGVFPIPQAVQNSWSLGYEFAFYFIASLFFIFSKHSKKAWIVIPFVLSVIFVIYHPRALFFLIGVVLYFIKDKHSFNKNVKIPTLLFLILTVISYEYNVIVSCIFGFFFFADMIKQNGFFSSILRTKSFQYLGTISYSLYLCHPFGIFPLKILLPKFMTNNTSWSFLVFVLVGSVLAISISHVFYLVVEKWLTTKIKNRNFLKAKNTHVSRKVS